MCAVSLVLLAKRIGKRAVPKVRRDRWNRREIMCRESEVGQQTMVTREEVEKGDR